MEKEENVQERQRDARGRDGRRVREKVQRREKAKSDGGRARSWSGETYREGR